MTILFRTTCFFIFIVASASIAAAPYAGRGKVEDILIRSSLDAFAVVYLDGFVEAGECRRYTSRDRVILAINNDERAQSIYALVLAARMSGKMVKVVVDDDLVSDDDMCLIKDIRLNVDF